MGITFHGAARTTTGSMHMLEMSGHKIMLDCGLYQGRRKEAFERNRNMPFDPAGVDAVILSHAHIDHSGNLPTLVKNGFRGRIMATQATIDLCGIMLRDSAYLQEKDVEFVNKRRAKQGKNPFEPLYGQADVDAVLDLFVPVPYGAGTEIFPGISVTLNDAGHILGSATVTIEFEYKGAFRRLLFTGDLGRSNMPILRDPVIPEAPDILITESTYGNRRHPAMPDVTGRLKGFIEDIHMQRAKLVIPSFSVGRTQELLYHFNELYKERRIPAVPIYVDSPLASKATAIYARHTECHDNETMKIFMEGSGPFEFRSLHFTQDTEESKRLNDTEGPMVVISASGMCEGGRILHHLAHTLCDPRNIILFVGYQAEHTLGRRIIERSGPVRIFGEEYDVKARVHTINALSAHADRDELMKFIGSFASMPDRAFVVHGEMEQSGNLAALLAGQGIAKVDIPEPGQSFDFDA